MTLTEYIAQNPMSFQTFVHLVVDVQRFFCDPTYVHAYPKDHPDKEPARGTKHTDMVSRHIAQITPAFRNLSIPTVIVYANEHEPCWHGARKKAMYKAWGGFHYLQPDKGDILIDKNRKSAFLQTKLHKKLTKLGRTNILLSGFNSGACIAATAKSGIALNYNIWLQTDCIGQDNDYEYFIGEHIDQMRKIGTFETTSQESLLQLACIQPPSPNDFIDIPH